jgi:hypothetical protein
VDSERKNDNSKWIVSGSGNSKQRARRRMMVLKWRFQVDSERKDNPEVDIKEERRFQADSERNRMTPLLIAKMVNDILCGVRE